MTREPNIIKDGFVSLIRGVDSSISPSLLKQDQAAFAVNCIFRDGYPQTRPRFFQLPFSFPNSEIAEWFENRPLQGGIVFAPKDRSASIFASVGGRIFKIDPLNGFLVEEITPTIQTTTTGNLAATAVGSNATVAVANPNVVLEGMAVTIAGTRWMVTSKSGSVLTVQNLDAPTLLIASGAAVVAINRNSEINGTAWFQGAEQFLIIQDGQSRAIIYDGGKTWRSDITKLQVPTGRAMAYGRGRLWVAVNKNEFVAGDIVGGSSGTAEYSNADGLLYFTENTFLAEGGAFSVPVQSGEITAMIFMPVLDTSTGNGPLLVFTEKAAFSVDASPDRDTWKNTRSPIQTVVQLGNGAVSQYAVAQTTNSDIFYRAKDGVRSFFLALRTFNQSWGNTPQSTEMNRVLESDDEKLLRFGSMIQFSNRLLFTVSPTPTAQNAKHGGIGVLDFDLISSMASKSAPAYDGMWTGFSATLLLKGDINGEERAFAFAVNPAGKNELWEISKKIGFDNSDQRVSSVLETRSMPGASPFEMKRLESVELFIDSVQGEVDFTLYYRSDQYPCWIVWGRDQSVCANWRDCPPPAESCHIPIAYRPGYKTRLNFGQPQDVDGTDGKPARLGYEHQFRIEWTGRCRIRKMVARFTPVPEETYPVVS